MEVKFFALDRMFAAHKHQYISSMEDALKTGQVVYGPAITELEEKLCNLTGRRYGITVGSATDALAFILQALGITYDDEVLIPAYSFIATASPIIRVGAKPVFVDVDEHYHLDFSKINHTLSSDTKALIFVNLFGDCIDFEQAELFCNDNNILLIEDAAQSLGAKFNKRPSGSIGVASSLSFSPTKPTPCFGTAGAILTDDTQIAEDCRLIRVHGKTSNGFTEMLGYNSILASDKAAQLNITLSHIWDWQQKRTEIATKYLRGLSNLPIELPLTREGCEHCWHKFTFRTNGRDELQKYLKSKNIDTKVHYRSILPAENIFPKVDLKEFSNSIKLTSSSLSLPIYPELTDSEVDYVITQIINFYRGKTWIKEFVLSGEQDL